MGYYPIVLRAAGLRCLIVGGGPVGERKARSLVAAGARVTLVSPTVTRGLARLAAQGRIAWRRRPYAPRDLRGAALVIAATGTRDLNAAVARKARRRRVWVNVVDDPALCTFIVPSVVARGPLLIALATGGASPALARQLRERLEKSIGPEYAGAVQILGAVRARLLTQGRHPDIHKAIFGRLVRSPLVRYIRRGDGPAIDRLLTRLLGPGMTRAGLGLRRLQGMPR